MYWLVDEDSKEMIRKDLDVLKEKYKDYPLHFKLKKSI